MKLQFSLGGLLAVVTICGVVAGMVKWSLDAGLTPWTIATVFVVAIGVIGLAVAKSHTL